MPSRSGDLLADGASRRFSPHTYGGKPESAPHESVYSKGHLIVGPRSGPTTTHHAACTPSSLRGLEALLYRQYQHLST